MQTHPLTFLYLLILQSLPASATDVLKIASNAKATESAVWSATSRMRAEGLLSAKRINGETLYRRTSTGTKAVNRSRRMYETLLEIT